MVFSSTTIIFLSLLMVVGGIVWQMGIASLLTLLLTAALAGGLVLMKMYLPPAVLVTIAIILFIGGLFSIKGASYVFCLLASLILAAVFYFAHIFLPQEMLVRLSLTLIFLMGLRFLAR